MPFLRVCAFSSPFVETCAFLSVEFGFEFFLPSVLSKVYRHVLADGHSVLELPEAVIALWCLPAPISSVRHGIRLRFLCRHKRSAQRAQINSPQRYHWIEVEMGRVGENRGNKQ